jgi:hypothetical protein
MRSVIFLPLWMLSINDLTLRAQHPVNYSSTSGRSYATFAHYCALTDSDPASGQCYSSVWSIENPSIHFQFNIFVNDFDFDQS